MGCRCCTPLTRLYLLVTEAVEEHEARLQTLVCEAFSYANIDAVLLVKTTPLDKLGDVIKSASHLARGAIISGYTLGALALDYCDDVDDDAVRAGAVDTMRFEDGRVKCRLYSVRALAECIPRGFTAGVLARYKWEVRLALAALRHRGYRRVVAYARVYELQSLGKVFNMSVSLETPEYLKHIADTLDAILVFDPELAEGVKGRVVKLDEVYPCVMAHFVSMVVSFWENVFIEPGRLRGLSETLFSKHHRRDTL